ncbi:MAG: hypothetical protein ACNA8W_02430 [Bradymonadaceae bacterium]
MYTRGLTSLAPILSLALILSVSAMAGCSDDNEGRLQGSVGSVYGLSFDQVRARLYTSELAIEYHRENGEVPVRLTLRHDDEEIKPGSFDLPERGDISGRSRGVDIPRLVSGKLRLESYEPRQGATVKGEFEAVLKSGDDRLTLTGEFEAPLEIVLHGYPIIDVGMDTSDTPTYPPDTTPNVPDVPAPQEDTPPVIVPDADPPEEDAVVVEDATPDVAPVEDTSPDVAPVEDTSPDVAPPEDAGPDVAPDVVVDVVADVAVDAG